MVINSCLLSMIVDLIIATSFQVNRNQFVSEEEYNCTSIIQLVHFVEIRVGQTDKVRV